MRRPKKYLKILVVVDHWEADCFRNEGIVEKNKKELKNFNVFLRQSFKLSRGIFPFPFSLSDIYTDKDAKISKYGEFNIFLPLNF